MQARSIDAIRTAYKLKDFRLETKRYWKPTLDRLTRQWYAPIRPHPQGPIREWPYDFSVYHDKDYVYDLDYCFCTFTCANLACLVRFVDELDVNVNSVLDIYGGRGEAAIVLAKLFPEAIIYYHQPVAHQAALAAELAADFKVSTIEHITQLRPAELVTAFEAMEHELNPQTFFSPVISDSTNIICTANSFTLDAVGHFDFYIDRHGNEVSRRQMGAGWMRWLDSHGYTYASSSKRYIYPKFYNRIPTLRIKNTYNIATPYKFISDRDWKDPIRISEL